ncbi:hypothetical protein JCM11251_005226 [Rhodosporidiobolus azoricus]
MPPRPPDPNDALSQPPHSPQVELDSPESGSAPVVHTLDNFEQTDAARAQQEGQEQETDNMGQHVSSQQHLVQLQEQLEQSVMRSTPDLDSLRSFAPVLDADEEDQDLDAYSRTPRQRSKTIESDPPADDVAESWSPGKGKKRSKPRPASSYIPTSLWASQLTSLSFPARTKAPASGGESSRPISSPSPTGPPSVATFARPCPSSSLVSSSPPRRKPIPASAPSSPAVPSSAKFERANETPSSTPPTSRSRSASVDPPFSRTSSLRRSPRSAATAAFRNSLRLPFLPSIPASPLPTLTSPGLTRSASSPPLLPAIETSGPLSPSFALIPPTASLRPEGTTGWPVEREGEGEEGKFPERVPTQHRSFASSRGATTSMSAPNLSLLASAPIEEPASEPSSSSSSASVAAVQPSPPSTESPYFPPSSSFSPAASNEQQLFSDSPASDSPPTADSPPSPGLQYSPGLLIPPTPTTASVSDMDLEDENEGEEEDQEEDKVKKVADDEKRYHALVELVETERGYLEGLRVLVKVYFQTLPFLTLLSVSEVHSIIRNADQLLALHERIGERIERVERELGWRREGAGEERRGEGDAEGESEVVEKEKDEKEREKEKERGRREKRMEEREKPARVRRAAKRIAEVFSDELPSFELYNDFCARHAEALDITRSIASRPEWEAYERQCALRACGELATMTPMPSHPKNARQNSYPFNTAPAMSNSPLPFSSGATPASTFASTPNSVAPSSAAATPATFISTTTSSSSASASRSKLRFVDYAISPVQRITRYPLVFGQLDKYFSSPPPPTSSQTSPRSSAPHPNSPAAAIRSTWDGFRSVASAVDAAKRQREGEMRTRIVAQRMEFNTPVVGGAFCDVLGPTLLVGAMHVLHFTGGDGSPNQATGAGRPGGSSSTSSMGGGGGSSGGGAGEVLKVKYYGAFLYRSHVVFAKIRKRATYEPREWLPLRLFDVMDVEEGQGFLTNSIRLSFRDHHFELGALCKGEKAVWLAQLLAAQAEARSAWDGQDLDERGQPTLFDDTVVSSVPAHQNATPLVQRKSHSRTTSSASVASVFSAALSTSSHLGATDEPMPPLPAEHAHSSATANGLASALATSAALTSVPTNSTSMSHSSHSHSHHGHSGTTPQFASRSRFSTTASSLLLGRTPSSQRAAVDLRLGDVFSESLLSARAQAAREADEHGSLSAAAVKRMRTVSGPKRSMTALTSAALPYAPYVVGAGTAARMLSAASAGAVPVQSRSRLERRRMSSVEVELGAAGREEFRGAIGFDARAAVVYRDDSALPLSSGSALSTSPLLGSRALPAMGPGGTPEKGSWARALKKGKGSSGSGSGKHRPSLPEIDTALAETMARSNGGQKRGMSTPLSAGGSWSRRNRGGGGRNEANGGPTLGGQLRRVASHNSLDTGGVRLPHSAVSTMLVLPTTTSPTTPIASVPVSAATPSARTAPATDVERNNSVSSSSSSNETGTRSSSSHVSRMIETPPSSIPPSPDFCNIELVDPLAIAGATAPAGANKLPSFSTSPATPQRSAFAGATHQSPSMQSSPRSVFDGMSSVFRIRRRKSTLGLVPPAVPTLSPINSPYASREDLRIAPVPSRSPTLISTTSREDYTHLDPSSAAAKRAIKLQRRASTTLTGLFSAKKRAQSTASLGGSSGYFSVGGGAGLGTASSPHLPIGMYASSTYSTSPPSSAAPSAYTSPATSPPVSQPSTPGCGIVMDLPPIAAGIIPPQPVPLVDPKGRRMSGGSAGLGGNTVKARRGFWGMTPLH